MVGELHVCSCSKLGGLVPLGQWLQPDTNTMSQWCCKSGCGGLSNVSTARKQGRQSAAPPAQAAVTCLQSRALRVCGESRVGEQL